MNYSMALFDNLHFTISGRKWGKIEEIKMNSIAELNAKLN